MSKPQKKISQDMKTILLTHLWQALTILLFGILCGYLLYKNADEQGGMYFVFSICIFGCIAILLFIRNVFRDKKRLREKKQREEQLKEDLEHLRRENDMLIDFINEDEEEE